MTRYKDPRYTINDSFYFAALCALVDELDSQEVNYSVVGGAAFQIKMASLLSGEKPFTTVAGLEGLLRKTGDIDLAVDSDLVSMVGLFNQMAATSHFYIDNTPRCVIIRKGYDSVSVNYQTGPEDFKGLSDHYHKIIDTSETVLLSNRRRDLSVRIPSLKYLFASKLIRLKEKDKVDICNLLNVLSHKGKGDLNLEQVRSVLKSIDKEESFDYLCEVFYDFHS